MLTSDLVDYSQRADLANTEKGRMRLKYKDPKTRKPVFAEFLNFNGENFLFMGSNIKKITNKIENSNTKEVSECIEQQKAKKTLEINPKVFEVIKKEIGEFEIVL